MSFAQETLPPIFQYIIHEIEKNNGEITTDEFKQILYTLRINRNDIKDIKIWLKENRYIDHTTKTIQLITILL